LNRSATNIASRWRMASIAYDVALILPQARIPADGIFGNDRGRVAVRVPLIWDPMQKWDLQFNTPIT
jgi:hypothetical protein